MEFKNNSDDCKGIIDCDIISNPINNIPIPVKTSPHKRAARHEKKTIRITPTIANTGAKTPISKAINCPVIVVPIFAPIITQIALFSFITLAFTKPINMTVIADEL